MIEPTSEITRPEHRRRAHLLAALMLPLMLSFGIGIIANWGKPALQISLAAGTIISFAAYRISRTPRYSLAAVLTVFVLSAPSFVAILARADHSESLRTSFSLLWLVIPLIFGSLWLSPGRVLIMAVAQFIAMMLLPVLAQDITFTHIIPAASILWTVSLLVIIASAIRHNDIQQIEGQVTAIQKSNTALQESEMRFRQVAENIEDVFWLVDIDLDQNVYISPAYSAIWGRETDLLYQDTNTFWESLHPEDVEEAKSTIRDQFRLLLHDEGLTQNTWEYRIIRPDGDIRWVETKIFPVKDREKHPYRIAAISSDITARKDAEKAQKELIDELNAFAHTVAHDLKNPLGVIAGYTSVLLDYADFPERYTGVLNGIIKTSDKMNEIIRELLRLASLRDASQANIEPIDMKLVVLSARSRVVNLIEKHDAHITVQDEWPVALGYAPWIEEVWANYLSNAIQYGGKPPQIRLGATLQNNSTIKFWVSDNGKGLTPEEQNMLFKQFSRLKKSRRVKGHGLGLSISKRIVERLGGTVSVESTLDEGSTFSFTLPIYFEPNGKKKLHDRHTPAQV